VLVQPLDVNDRQAVRDATRHIEDALGAVDLAVFNAGIGRRLRVEAFSADDFVSVMTTNVFGVVFGIEAVLPGMLARRRGQIAAVASLAGYRSVPTLAGYGTSKAALIHLLECLRYDLRPHGIGITIINPGYIRTPLTVQNTYWMPFLMDPDPAARIIVDGLRRDRKEIHFPKRFSWILKALQRLPYPLYERLITAAVRR
jgi:NAD(P)-dependent dehydrogenase (short-subunit alcohol dehydrogenase family)